MLRKILAILVGYLAMALFIAVTFGVTFAVLGADGVFEPGTFDPSTTWLILSFLLGVAGAMLAGLICKFVARDRKTVFVFAGIVFVLGLALAVPQALSDAPDVERLADVSGEDAALYAKQPVWVALLNPFVGAIGILVGARLRRDA